MPPKTFWHSWHVATIVSASHLFLALGCCLESFLECKNHGHHTSCFPDILPPGHCAIQTLCHPRHCYTLGKQDIVPPSYCASPDILPPKHCATLKNKTLCHLTKGNRQIKLAQLWNSFMLGLIPPLIFGSNGTGGTHLTCSTGVYTKCVPF